MGGRTERGPIHRRVRRADDQAPPARRCCGGCGGSGKSGRLPLLSWHTIPEYLRDNEYIITGYRANWPVRDSLRSLFQLHNETGNVWTHLLGFVFFVFLTVWAATAPPAALALDKEPLDDLWSSVQDNLHTLSDQIGEGVHALQGSLQLRALEVHAALQQSLQSLSANLEDRAMALQDKMQGMQSQVKGQLEVAQHGLHENLVSLRDYLSLSVHSLEERIHTLQGHLGAMAGSLKDRLGIVREHLNSSYQGLQGNLHALQNNLTGNMGVVRERMANNLGSLRLRISGSCTNFQESLRSLQELLASGSHGFRKTSNKVWSIVRWPMFVYMAGAMICMLLSTTCHLFACCSKDVSSVIWRFDYAGIAVLIVTSFYPPVYYGFMCNPIWKMLYLLPISLLGISLTLFSTVTAFQSRKFRAVRAGLFALLGLYGVFPLCHQWLINSHIPEVRTVLLYEVAMGSIYLAAAAVFVLRVPERFKPGAFDVFFHSHQFFHVLVVLAAYVHFQAVVQLMDWRNTTGCDEMQAADAG